MRDSIYAIDRYLIKHKLNISKEDIELFKEGNISSLRSKGYSIKDIIMLNNTLNNRF